MYDYQIILHFGYHEAAGDALLATSFYSSLEKSTTHLIMCHSYFDEGSILIVKLTEEWNTTVDTDDDRWNVFQQAKQKEE